MLDEIMERLESISRRGFLSRIVPAAAAMALGVIGFTPMAMAGGGTGPGCCNLCRPTGCTYPPQCVGQWCWTCDDQHGDLCRKFACYECYTTGTVCSDCGHCTNNDGCPTGQVVCSKGFNIGIC